MTLPNVDEALKLIDFAIWYLMGFCLLSHLSRHTRVYIWRGGKGFRFRSPPLLMPAVYNVRCTSYYDITLMPATLSSHWSEHPGPWLAGSGAWQWRVSIETFSSFRQPYPLSQSRQTKQQSIAKFLEKHNEFSTILLTKLCLMSVQGCCTAPTLWRPSLSHMLTCSTICSNINR